MKKEDIVIAFMIGLTHLVFALFASTIQIRMIFPGYAGLFFLFASVYLLIKQSPYNIILFMVALLSLGSLFYNILGTNYAWSDAGLVHVPLHIFLGFSLIIYGSIKTYQATIYLYKDVRLNPCDFPENRDVYDPKKEDGPTRKHF